MHIYTSVGKLLCFHQGLNYELKCIVKIRGWYFQNKCLNWELIEGLLKKLSTMNNHSLNVIPRVSTLVC
jgi:hypothetical protein